MEIFEPKEYLNSERVKTLSDYLKNAVLCVPDGFTRRKPKTMKTQVKWDRLRAKAIDLVKDQSDMTIEQIMDDPIFGALVNAQWVPKKRPKESTIRRRLEGHGIAKVGRRRAE